MKKRRRRTELVAVSTSPATLKRWSAENLARTAIETDPRLKRAKDHITTAVLAATEKALKTSLRHGAKKTAPAE